jgi:hypothetical protein
MAIICFSLWRLELVSIINKLLLAAVFFLVLASCSSTKADKDKIIFNRPGGTDIILIPDNFVASYITSSVNNERNCLAPAPDVTDSSADSLKLGDAAGDAVGLTDGETTKGLGDITPNLLLARELLFRACELTSNINADTETSITIYNSFLKSIVDISVAEKSE